MTVADRFSFGYRELMSMTLRELTKWADMAVDLIEQDRRAWSATAND
jgi:hypothetical protein